MTYSRPEIAELGNAARLIQILGKGQGGQDGTGDPRPEDPAYDLDE
jgi:hypothetical protein